MNRLKEHDPGAGRREFEFPPVLDPEAPRRSLIEFIDSSTTAMLLRVACCVCGQRHLERASNSTSFATLAATGHLGIPARIAALRYFEECGLVERRRQGLIDGLLLEPLGITQEGTHQAVLVSIFTLTPKRPGPQNRAVWGNLAIFQDVVRLLPRTAASIRDEIQVFLVGSDRVRVKPALVHLFGVRRAYLLEALEWLIKYNVHFVDVEIRMDAADLPEDGVPEEFAIATGSRPRLESAHGSSYTSGMTLNEELRGPEYSVGAGTGQDAQDDDDVVVLDTTGLVDFAANATGSGSSEEEHQRAILRELLARTARVQREAGVPASAFPLGHGSEPVNIWAEDRASVFELSIVAAFPFGVGGPSATESRQNCAALMKQVADDNLAGRSYAFIFTALQLERRSQAGFQTKPSRNPRPRSHHPQSTMEAAQTHVCHACGLCFGCKKDPVSCECTDDAAERFYRGVGEGPAQAWFRFRRGKKLPREAIPALPNDMAELCGTCNNHRRTWVREHPDAGKRASSASPAPPAKRARAKKGALRSPAEDEDSGEDRRSRSGSVRSGSVTGYRAAAHTLSSDFANEEEAMKDLSNPQEEEPDGEDGEDEHEEDEDGEENEIGYKLRVYNIDEQLTGFPDTFATLKVALNVETITVASLLAKLALARDPGGVLEEFFVGSIPGMQSALWMSSKKPKNGGGRASEIEPIKDSAALRQAISNGCKNAQEGRKAAKDAFNLYVIDGGADIEPTDEAIGEAARYQAFAKQICCGDVKHGAGDPIKPVCVIAGTKHIKLKADRVSRWMKEAADPEKPAVNERNPPRNIALFHEYWAARDSTEADLGLGRPVHAHAGPVFSTSAPGSGEGAQNKRAGSQPPPLAPASVPYILIAAKNGKRGRVGSAQGDTTLFDALRTTEMPQNMVEQITARRGDRGVRFFLDGTKQAADQLTYDGDTPIIDLPRPPSVSLLKIYFESTSSHVGGRGTYQALLEERDKLVGVVGPLQHPPSLQPLNRHGCQKRDLLATNEWDRGRRPESPRGVSVPPRQRPVVRRGFVHEDKLPRLVLAHADAKGEPLVLIPLPCRGFQLLAGEAESVEVVPNRRHGNPGPELLLDPVLDLRQVPVASFVQKSAQPLSDASGASEKQGRGRVSDLNLHRGQRPVPLYRYFPDGIPD
ncbi:hypothetical protein DFJ74DRAFT_753836 [Hyaloraphidium curvatum]|nr:hypothetical protein DFJ74DRAFT_753836 [Hyaloraphidium curvatum]